MTNREILIEQLTGIPIWRSATTGWRYQFVARFMLKKCSYKLRYITLNSNWTILKLLFWWLILTLLIKTYVDYYFSKNKISWYLRTSSYIHSTHLTNFSLYFSCSFHDLYHWLIFFSVKIYELMKPTLFSIRKW